MLFAVVRLGKLASRRWVWGAALLWSLGFFSGAGIDSRRVSADDSTPADPPLLDLPLRDASHVARWRRLHDVGQIDAVENGLRIEIRGDDPYVASPRVDLPADTPLQLRLQLRSETGGTGQVFYFREQTTEAQSVRFGVPAGRDYEVLLPLPPLGPRYQFRFDPPGTSGSCVLQRFVIERPLSIEPPGAPGPEPFVPADDDVTLTSGRMSLRHAAGKWHELTVSRDGKSLAVAHNRLRFGYLVGKEQRWTRPQAAKVERRDDELLVVAKWRDEDGAEWTVEQQFHAERDEAIRVVTKTSVDRARRVTFVPSLVLLAGLQSFERRKTQGLLAGVEYLDDEPSSSTADLEGPAALRRVPAAHKVTFPLMVVQANDNYLALRWRRAADVAPLFDSPDRIWNSASHVLGLISPGADPRYRYDGQPGVHQPWTLKPETPLEVVAEIYSGAGRSIVPAVQTYVERAGLPSLPGETQTSSDDTMTQATANEAYLKQTLAGWLDTPLRDGPRFRHAVGNNFGAQPAADAAWLLDWLADSTTDVAARERARQAATEALSAVAEPSLYHSHVGHLKPPVAGLVYDRYDATREQARQLARGILGRFNSQGEIELPVDRRGIDFARTNPTRTANGLTAEPLVRLLEAALYSGDRELLGAAIDRLKIVAHYDHAVPRGAQTWEIPLHTPDILASAHLVKACVLAFRATADATWLERARDWAWTGVPFVYLDAPTNGAVGVYATTPVLGATHWEAPVWIGLPVQWCGLVYADSLLWLAPHDEAGPWQTIARGIVRSAMLQNYPLGHRHQGLLPDSFDLVAQARNPADINPGTLQPLAMQMIRGVPAYDVEFRRGKRQWAIAAGEVQTVKSEANDWEIKVTPWSSRGSVVAVQGLAKRPRVIQDGKPAADDTWRFDAANGSATLKLSSATPVTLRLQGVDE